MILKALLFLLSILSDSFSTLLGFFSGFAAAIFAEPIRQWLFKPKLNLEYDEGRGCLSKTQEAISASVVGDAYYIRVRVTNASKIIAKDCRAYLVNIEKRDEKGGFASTVYCDSIQVAWSCQGREDRYRGIDICKGVNQYLDLIVTRSNSDEFDPQIMVKPFRYSELFKETGAFRFTIQASAARANPATIKLIFEWNAEWDKFQVAKGT
jgi:hypothetical protein